MKGLSLRNNVLATIASYGILAVPIYQHIALNFKAAVLTFCAVSTVWKQIEKIMSHFNAFLSLYWSYLSCYFDLGDFHSVCFEYMDNVWVCVKLVCLFAHPVCVCLCLYVCDVCVCVFVWKSGREFLPWRGENNNNGSQPCSNQLCCPQGVKKQYYYAIPISSIGQNGLTFDCKGAFNIFHYLIEAFILLNFV